ncbi:Conserved_hypothetical protein [Hexamita inflata]|uniref:Ankyrin repeat protein n=1 Tax=Hexamita inflata TaxID=28002 RepID=A0AA86REH1_9EUKA|nr:Conserved hypothetical protein [Hexamita inflata]
MFDLCKRDASWFISAQKNDIASIETKLNKNVGTRDFRQTKIDEGIIKGFTALHYACYNGCMEVVKFLVPHEIGLMTQKEVAIPAPGFSDCAKYKLVGGSTCLTIALLRGKGEVVKFLINHLETNKEAADQVIGHLDEENLCTYLMGTICTFDEAFKFLRNKTFIDAEFFLCATGDMTPVMNAAFFGRPYFAKIITELSEDPKYQEGIYKMALNRDSSEATCLELALLEVDYKKYGCTPEDKQETYQILKKLCIRAANFAKNADKKIWAPALHTFTQGLSFEQIFGADAVLHAETKEVVRKIDNVKKVEESSDSDSDSDDSESEEQPKPTAAKPVQQAKPVAKKEESSDDSSDESS